MTDSNPGPSNAFTRYACIVLFYLLLVIIYGAWVRITGSGDGCGANWPDCHGQFVPEGFIAENETLIEYTHRITSGLLGPMGLVLVGWAWKRFGSHRVFWASLVTVVFIVFESLIGAGLVLAELVGDDDSAARAVVISIHLINTLALTGSAALVAWWSTGKPMPRWSNRTAMTWLLIVAVAGVVITGTSGAITALGDTLFPTDPTIGDGLFAGVRDDLSAANHFLVRLRVLHPVIAVGFALYVMAVNWVARLRSTSRTADRWGTAALALVVGQTVIGALNIALGAPGWMQMLHLAVAQLVWISVLLWTVATMHADHRRTESRAQ